MHARTCVLTSEAARKQGPKKGRPTFFSRNNKEKAAKGDNSKLSGRVIAHLFHYIGQDLIGAVS